MGSRPRLHGGRLFEGTTEIGAGMTGGVWVGTGGSRTAPTGWVVKSALTAGEGRFEGRPYGERKVVSGVRAGVRGAR